MVPEKYLFSVAPFDGAQGRLSAFSAGKLFSENAKIFVDVLVKRP
jgi:hypothetical protein